MGSCCKTGVAYNSVFVKVEKRSGKKETSKRGTRMEWKDVSGGVEIEGLDCGIGKGDRFLCE